MTYDPYETAMNPPERPQTSRWFGQMFVDVWPCVLTKGVGKEPFDPNLHDADKRLTAIQMSVVPLSDYNVTFSLDRDMIAEFGAWPKVTLPSVKSVGVDLRELDKAWVAVEFAPTGRKWTDKNTGEEKEETAFVLMAVFDSEAACREAYETFNAGDQDAAAEPSNGNGKEKQVASQFLRPLWAQAGGDVQEMAKLLAGNPLTSKHFDINSPEVVELIAEAS